MKRREFLKHLTRTTAALSATALSFRRIASASERVRVALIGCGGRGTHVAKLMAQMPGVLSEQLQKQFSLPRLEWSIQEPNQRCHSLESVN